MKNLQEALLGISIDSGYHHDIAEFAVKLDPNHEVETMIGGQPLRPFLILELLPDRFEYVEKPSRVRVLMPFTIHAVNESDPKLDDALLATYLRLVADVERAIAGDIERGGLATDTRILRRRMHDLGGEQVWAMVEGEIREHREYGEPNG